MEETINQFMMKALEYLQSAEAFASREIPLFVEELIKYNLYTNVASLVGIIVIAAILIYIVVKGTIYTKQCMDDNLDRAGVLVLIIIGFSIGVICCLSEISRRTDNIIKLSVAPRVFLIDYIKNNNNSSKE